MSQAENFSPETAGPQCGPFACDPPTAVKVGAVVLAFVAFPPLGVAALAFLALRGRGGRRWRAFREEARFARSFGDFDPRFGGPRRHGRGRGFGRSRNGAFNEAQQAGFESLAAERQRLHEEAEAFAEFERKLKRDRDAKVFDAFLAEKNAQAAAQATRKDGAGE